MKSRFEGADGKRRLVEALKSQRLVEHSEPLAIAIAEQGELLEIQTGAEVVVQGGADNDIYFIIEGQAGIYVNRRHVGTREAHEAIGEMAMIDPSARRSATVIASTPLTLVRMTEPAMQDLIKSDARAWRALSLIIAERLRQRSRFHRPPNERPVLFVGSSVEGLKVAQEIVVGLKHDKVLVRPWNSPGVFGPGGVSVDVLLAEVDACDFAAFVFGPDDMVFSRGETYEVPRDNVIFELGLFMGRLDRNRSFIVKEHSSEVKIPTDLLGVTPISYVVKPGEELSQALGPVCVEIRKAIDHLGVL